MMKNTNNRYEAPQAEVIAIESQGVLCASGGSASGAGINGMNSGSTYGW